MSLKVVKTLLTLKTMRVPGLLLAILLTIGSAAAQRFELDQVAEHFPSAGFEDEIEFWTQIFTRFGNQDVVFHDRKDLRLVYDVVRLEKDSREDPDERKRQNDQLQEEKKTWRTVLEELADGLPEADWSPAHRSVLEKLTRFGYTPDSKLYQRLSREVRYQRGIREDFREGLIRSGRYFDAIERIFREQGVPVELAVMPHIESSFRYQVVSKVGAVGLWQFVRSTGRLFLKINSTVDERLDPLEATQAAAQLHKTNYEILESWPLAITAYNHGAASMKRARRQFGPDMRKIASNYNSRRFGFASRNFYPEFLAALQISRNEEYYFGRLEKNTPVSFEKLTLARSYRLSDITSTEGVAEEILRDLNPAIRSRVWSRKVFPKGLTLRVPAGYAEPIKLALQDAKPLAPAGYEVDADGSIRYHVRGGDTLAKISSRFGISQSRVLAANSIGNPDRIYRGQILLIPGVEQAPTSRRYQVRSGDTLARIAKQFKTSVGHIMRANNLRNANRIFRGQVLIIP